MSSEGAQPDVPLLGWGNPADGQALQPFNIHTNALAASLVVKTGPGVLYGFTAFNARVSAQFVQVFDTIGLPADGAVPVAVFTVPTVANLAQSWLPGRTFQYGIVIANSSTSATKTIGSADCWFDVQYL